MSDPSTSAFTPHNDGGKSEEMWNSNNPKGAIMTFHSFFSEYFSVDDAAVLTSMSEPDYWVFTPVSTIHDAGHPLAGHRQFGLTNNQDGTYTFYTRAVDLMYGPLDVLANHAKKPMILPGGVMPTIIPQKGAFFDLANDLWNSVMENVVRYIEENGGEAEQTHSFQRSIDFEKDVKSEDKSPN